MGSRATFCRLKAEQCAALAKTMTDGVSRRELEKAAAQWLSLANDAELLDRLKRNAEPRPDVAAARAIETDGLDHPAIAHKEKAPRPGRAGLSESHR